MKTFNYMDYKKFWAKGRADGERKQKLYKRKMLIAERKAGILAYNLMLALEDYKKQTGKYGCVAPTLAEQGIYHQHHAYIQHMIDNLLGGRDILADANIKINKKRIKLR